MYSAGEHNSHLEKQNEELLRRVGMKEKQLTETTRESSD